MVHNGSKRHLFCNLIVFSFLFSSVMAHNPIISQKYTADPSAMVYNDRIYVYCSRDDNNNDNYDIIDYTLISSDDLVNWTDHGEVFKVPEMPSGHNMHTLHHVFTKMVSFIFISQMEEIQSVLLLQINPRVRSRML